MCTASCNEGHLTVTRVFCSCTRELCSIGTSQLAPHGTSSSPEALKACSYSHIPTHTPQLSASVKHKTAYDTCITLYLLFQGGINWHCIHNLQLQLARSSSQEIKNLLSLFHAPLSDITPRKFLFT